MDVLNFQVWVIVCDDLLKWYTHMNQFKHVLYGNARTGYAGLTKVNRWIH